MSFSCNRLATSLSLSLFLSFFFALPISFFFLFFLSFFLFLYPPCKLRQITKHRPIPVLTINSPKDTLHFIVCSLLFALTCWTSPLCRPDPWFRPLRTLAVGKDPVVCVKSSVHVKLASRIDSRVELARWDCLSWTMIGAPRSKAKGNVFWMFQFGSAVCETSNIVNVLISGDFVKF